MENKTSKSDGIYAYFTESAGQVEKVLKKAMKS